MEEEIERELTIEEQRIYKIVNNLINLNLEKFKKK